MKKFTGELIGTFILVFLGCGSVAYTILIEPLSLLQISIVWGIAVTIAIYASAPFSKAHLNPAVSFGFLLKRAISSKDLFPYLSGQFVGAFLAAAGLFLAFKENLNVKNLETASMFGEYYPNPGNADLESLSMTEAMGIESLGTFFLMFGILLIVGLKLKKGSLFNPLLIGILLSILIYFLAPYTQAGLNPARDLSPRLFSYLMGWKEAFSFNGLGWFSVYVLSPIAGAVVAAQLHKMVSK